MAASDFDNPRRGERWDENQAESKPEAPPGRGSYGASTGGRAPDSQRYGYTHEPVYRTPSGEGVRHPDEPMDSRRQSAPEREEHVGYSGAYRSQAGPAGDDRPDPTHRFDPDYHEWRAEQMRQLDKDYALWRQERYRKFAEEFETWRRQRFSGERGTSVPRGNAAGPSFVSPGRASAAGFRNPPLGNTNALDAGASAAEPSAARPRTERSERVESADRMERLDKPERSEMPERTDRGAERTDRPDRSDRPEKGGGLLSGLLGTGPGRK